MSEDERARLHAALIQAVREHGPDVLLSPRARREQASVQRRFQAIMDGPIPQAQRTAHGALLPVDGQARPH